ncbi:MAG TPA: ferritin-like domain-containing protein, partial [Solirubrobacteraceae bacterium]|nr:ferritin-like domain-containing protein [Solirubrobacteraceae bacterium]
LARPAAAAAQAAREADALTQALRHEHVGVFAYDAVLAADVLRADEQRRAERIRGHEAQHAEALAKALGELGWPLPPAPGRAEHVEVPEVRAAVDALRDRRDALALLARVEQLASDVHRAAIARLRDGRHIQLAATILAAEASHLVVWSPPIR